MMVSKKSIEKQLQAIGFKSHGWGRGEVNELPNIILPDEEIYECVNGIYDGGFALLVATDIRVLLIDQKPMNYLTVEDLRFDMINEMDYSHRLLGARISISSGNKTLKFLSYNQPRLRKLIGHVQHCMAESKKKQSYHDESQADHLAKINEKLQEYLMEQQKQQGQIQQQLAATLSGSGKTDGQNFTMPAPIEPSDELKDYLFAQSLLAQHQTQAASEPLVPPVSQIQPAPAPIQNQPQLQPAANDLYEEGMREVFGKHVNALSAASKSAGRHAVQNIPMPSLPHLPNLPNAREANPLNIAYSKLPLALSERNMARR